MSIRTSLSIRYATKLLVLGLAAILSAAVNVLDSGPDVVAVLPHPEEFQVEHRLARLPVPLLFAGVHFDLCSLFHGHIFKRLKDPVFINRTDAHFKSPAGYFTLSSLLRLRLRTTLSHLNEVLSEYGEYRNCLRYQRGTLLKGIETEALASTNSSTISRTPRIEVSGFLQPRRSFTMRWIEGPYFSTVLIPMPEIASNS